MSKALPASCVGGVVTSMGVPVLTATKLSEGVGSSDGILVLEEDTATYIAKTTPDLKTTLEKLISALGNITSALGILDTKVTTLVPTPPFAVTDIAAITAIQAQLTLLKEILK